MGSGGVRIGEGVWGRGGSPLPLVEGWRMTGSAFKRWTLYGRSGRLKKERGSGGEGARDRRWAKAGGFFWSTFFASFSLLKINMFFDRFGVAFGWHFGFILGAKIDPSRAKFGPRWLLKRYFLKKVNFTKIL